MTRWAVPSVVAASLALLGLLAAASGAGTRSASATPVSDATIVATPFSVGDDSVGASFASCPAGQRVVGGGVGQTSPIDVHSPAVEQSGPLGDSGTTAGTQTGDVARSWYAAVRVLRGEGQVDFRVFAICSRTSDATVVATPFSVNGGSAGAAFATCPADRRVVGGGVGQTGPVDTPFGLIEQSGPLGDTGTTAGTADGAVGRSWYAAVTVFLGAGTRDFRVFAICSANSDATIAVTKLPLDPGKFGGTTAQCPAGKRAVGGGVGQDGPVDQPFDWIVQNGPLGADGTTAGTATGDVARYWYAAVVNLAGSREYRVFAICANDTATPSPPAPKPKLSVSGFSVGKARAGHQFTAAFTVKSGGKGVKGSVSCSARLNGKPFAASHHSVSQRGVAICSWSLPRSASGERLTGSISERYRGAKASRSFSLNVT